MEYLPKSRAVKTLEQWLKDSYASDVLIPVSVGQKNPAFRHANNAWSWTRFNETYRAKDHDVGVLLQNICVVDIDTVKLVHEFEKRFPVLSDVPCESTRKGRHYFFERSPLADREGYFDARSQVTPGVDFKTRCKTGNAGLIIVAPSTNKRWIRAPWNDVARGGKLVPIPDELLRAVARPQHKTATAVLEFADSEETVCVTDNLHLARCDYMAPFFEEFADEEGSVTILFPSHIDSNDVFCVLDVLDGGVFPVMRSAEAESLVATADFMGVPMMKSFFSLTVPYSKLKLHMDLCSVDADWAKYAQRDELVVLNPSTMYSLVSYTPLPKDERWLLHEYPATSIEPGTSVLYDYPYLYESLPHCVKWVLMEFPGVVVLAGSAALSQISPFVKSNKDFDLFVCTKDASVAHDVLAHMAATSGILKSSRTGCAFTYVVRTETGKQIIVQLVLKLFDSLEHLLVQRFDLPPCKVAIHHDLKNGFVITATQACLASLRHMAFWVHPSMWSVSTTSRVFKYYHKGFDVFVPGLIRDALRDCSGKAEANGWKTMFHVEEGVRTCCRDAAVRPGFADIYKCVSKYNYWGNLIDSGYAERHSWRRRVMRNIVDKLFRNTFIRWTMWRPVFGRSEHLQVVWERANEAGFMKRNANIHQAFDMEKYEAVCQARKCG